MANNKMTNLKALIYVLENCVLPDDVFEKVKNIKTSLAKKSDGSNKKMTAKQVENEKLKDAILNFLMAENCGYTITEITEFVEELNGLSNQKVSALTKQLVDDNLVKRVEDKKGKATFSVPTATPTVAETEPLNEVVENEEVAEPTEVEPTEEV
nr:MAG TPA: Mnd1, Putative tbpip family protein cycle.2A [Caudoviricetes sp.]